MLSNSQLTCKSAVSTHKEHEIQKNPIMGSKAKSMRAGDEKLMQQIVALCMSLVVINSFLCIQLLPLFNQPSQ